MKFIEVCGHEFINLEYCVKIAYKVFEKEGNWRIEFEMANSEIHHSASAFHARKLAEEYTERYLLVSYKYIFKENDEI